MPVVIKPTSSLDLICVKLAAKLLSYVSSIHLSPLYSESNSLVPRLNDRATCGSPLFALYLKRFLLTTLSLATINANIAKT